MGLGLFGVLSIIRLRSTELDQPEVSYYLSSLALGLLASLGARPRTRRLNRRGATVGVLAMTEPLALLGPITLAELLEHAALHSRVDRKYVLPVDQVSDLAGGPPHPVFQHPPG